MQELRLNPVEQCYYKGAKMRKYSAPKQESKTFEKSLNCIVKPFYRSIYTYKRYK